MTNADFEVYICGFKSLTDDQKNEQHGPGKEWASYLVVKYRGEIIRVESDEMEPEDCSFNRDLKWIKSSLIQAYELGRLSEKGGADTTSRAG